MPRIMQNLVILMELFKEAEEVSLKGGNMCLNRFCIDEDAAFELSSIHYLRKSSDEMINSGKKLQRKLKDKGFLSHLKLALEK